MIDSNSFGSRQSRRAGKLVRSLLVLLDIPHEDLEAMVGRGIGEMEHPFGVFIFVDVGGLQVCRSVRRARMTLIISQSFILKEDAPHKEMQPKDKVL